MARQPGQRVQSRVEAGAAAADLEDLFIAEAHPTAQRGVAARQYSHWLTWLTTRFTTSRALPLMLDLAPCSAR
jgi:hypothetical protein